MNGATTGRWPASVIALHWIMAGIIVATMTLGWVAEAYPSSPDKVRLFVWHKSLGITVLLLLALRLPNRLRCVAPAVSAGMSRIRLSAARAVQFLLYCLMAVMPLSGWVINSAADFPLKLFGRVPWPAIVGPDEQLKELAESVHQAALWILVALLVLHVAAALHHHFVLRDGVLRAVLPGRAK